MNNIKPFFIKIKNEFDIPIERYIRLFCVLNHEGFDLVVVEKEDIDNGTFKSALILYGFDEIGIFDSEFNNPIYGYLSTNIEEL